MNIQVVGTSFLACAFSALAFCLPPQDNNPAPFCEAQHEQLPGVGQAGADCNGCPFTLEVEGWNSSGCEGNCTFSITYTTSCEGQPVVVDHTLLLVPCGDTRSRSVTCPGATGHYTGWRVFCKSC